MKWRRRNLGAAAGEDEKNVIYDLLTDVMTKMIIKQEEFINGVKVFLIFCDFPPSPTMPPIMPPPPPLSLFLWQYFLQWMREMKNSWINVCVFAFFLCVIFNFPAISFVELGFSPSFINKLWKCLYGCDIVWLMIFHLKEINYNSFAIFCCCCWWDVFRISVCLYVFACEWWKAFLTGNYDSMKKK